MMFKNTHGEYKSKSISIRPLIPQKKLSKIFKSTSIINNDSMQRQLYKELSIHLNYTKLISCNNVVLSWLFFWGRGLLSSKHQI